MNKLISLIFIISTLYLSIFGDCIYADSFPNKQSFKEINEILKKTELIKNEKEKRLSFEHLAEAFLENKQDDFAIDIYNRLINTKRLPKNLKFKYYVKLGDVYDLQKNYGLSLENYRKALSFHKKNIEVRLMIGNIFLKSNLYNLAENAFLEILSINKNSDLAKKGLGDVYYYKNMEAKAVSYYIQMDYRDYDRDTIIKLVNCYRSLKKIEDAVKLLDYFMEENKDAKLYFLSGLLNMDNKEYLKAQEAFLKSIDYDDKNFKVYMYLASIYDLIDKPYKAKKMLDKAYELDSSYAVVDLMQAKTLYKMGKTKEAKEYAKRGHTKAKTAFTKEYAKKMVDYLKNK